MNSAPVDLRSDTVTKPTKQMLEAMFAATVGDDVFGEDQAVNELEAEVARGFGKDAALYVPSGTMANQLALAVQTRPGDSIIAEADAHCFLFESGGAAALSGLQFEFVPRETRMADEAIKALARPESIQYATTTMLVVENTHNVAGGRVLHLAEMQRIARTAQRLGLKTHCDGARIWNAAAALQVSEAELAADFETVAVCFSKGLGAPMGSALIGPKPVIQRARKLRKRWGGGMRQIGYMAAGALYAFRHHRERLAIDHRHAAALAESLRGLAKGGAPIEVVYPDPGTNMVYFRLSRADAEDLAPRLAERGVRVIPMGGGWLRAVTHLDVSEAGIERAITELSRLIKKGA